MNRYKNTAEHAVPCYDVSVVVAFRDEGRTAYRTLCCLEKSLSLARSHGLRVETVLVLDQVTDKILIQIVDGWKDKVDACQAFHVTYRSPSRAKNFAIGKSQGKFITSLDGKDVVCRDWLVKAFELCKTTGAIAHPELCYFFPRSNYVLLNQDISQYRVLIHHNLWPALTMAPRHIHEEVPYRPDADGSASVSWLWNCETVGCGFSHLVVPKTVVAIRQNAALDAPSQPQALKNRVVPSNVLFRAILSEPHRSRAKNANRLERLKGNETLNKAGSEADASSHNPCKLSSGRSHPYDWGAKTMTWLRPSEWFKLLRVHPRFRFIRDRISPKHYDAIREMINLVRQLMLTALPLAKTIVGIPSYRELWLREQLLDMARTEPEIRFVGQAKRNVPKSSIPVHIPPEAGALLETPNARVFILPWLIRGGADLVAVHYMNAVQERVFLITTQHADNDFLQFIPSTAIHIDLGSLPLYDDEKELILHRLLLEADCDFIHVINSRLAFDLFERYPATFKNLRVFTSFFAIDIVEGFEAGFPVEHFARLLDFFERISTDNVSFKKKLEQLYGLREDLIAVHRMPFSPPHYNMISEKESSDQQKDSPSTETERLRLFFAGRFAASKRPQVAINAVESLLKQGQKVSLDVWGEPYESFRMPRSTRPEIKFRGHFQGLATIPLQDYDVMIMTSESEGLPNTLIECMGNGIPAVASNVGGVSEIVNEETGWLVNDYSDTRAFEVVLESLLRDKPSVGKKGVASREFVRKNHSWNDFQVKAGQFYGAR